MLKKIFIILGILCVRPLCAMACDEPFLLTKLPVDLQNYIVFFPTSINQEKNLLTRYYFENKMVCKNFVSNLGSAIIDGADALRVYL